MSVKDYLKVINIQDLTTGDIIKTIPVNNDRVVNTDLSLFELELLINVLEVLKDEHNVVVKTGYKGQNLL